MQALSVITLFLGVTLTMFVLLIGLADFFSPDSDLRVHSFDLQKHSRDRLPLSQAIHETSLDE